MKHWFRLFAAGWVFVALAANADVYPSKPVTIVVGFAPGSGIDVVTRAIARRLEHSLGQTVVIENRPGANAAIAAVHVSRASPDGYTLMPGGGFYSSTPYLMKSISYDPQKDFAPITLIGSFAYMVVVNPRVPVQSVPELIAYAKANPGKLSFASSNPNGIVSGETFKRWAGIDIVHVHYKSAPPAINDVLGGSVSMMFADVTTALPHVRARTLRGLAVTGIKRNPLLPDLPSLHEAGLTGFDVASWNGIWAPAKTPAEIITRLSVEIRRIVDDPQIKAQLGELGFEAFSSTPDEMGRFAELQRAKWSKMIKDAEIEPQ
jgi:tripartite-type tricarboxylate transporter receptor subunit TctC